MKVSLSWFLVFLLPIYSEAVDCTTLPDYNFLVTRLQVLVDSEGGEGIEQISVQDGPYYTCQVQGTIKGTYQQLSIIMTYNTVGNAAIRVKQFELDCFGNTDWDSRGTLTTVGNTVDYMNIAVFTNCSACTGTNTNDNHCQDCNSNCNSGLMRCTGTGSNDCCAAFESNGMCSPDPNCEQNNFVANEQNNFTCECGISSCSDGESFNSTACNCDLTDICLADNPCVNGVCKLGSSPDQYTCNCTSTNYMGTNCSVLIPMITTTSSVGVVTSTTSSTTMVSTTSSVCSNGCNTCNNTCCISCTNGYNLNGCTCDKIIDSTNCNVSSCINCAIGNCCSQCQDGYTISMCSCVQTATTTTNTITGSTGSTTPTPTTSTNKKSGLNDNSLIGIIISIIIGTLMILVLVVLIIYVIYYIMDGAAITAAKTKLSEPILFGEAHDNPMYLDPELIAN